MTIDRALSGNPFRIDQLRCLDAGKQLRGFKAEHRQQSWSNLPTRSQFIFKVLFISVCQQFNWDFLQAAMADWLLPDPESLLPLITQIRAPDVARMLAAYPKPERILATQRAKMLRTTASELQLVISTGSVDALFSERRLEGPGGLYDVMSRISAFTQDELEKKIRVLAHDLHRERILAFVDPENLRPAIEYHLLRLYIRSGRVHPTNDAIREHLTGASSPSRPRLVRLLRKAVGEAMGLTSFYSGLDIATLNYVEWQIGRSVCISERQPRWCHDAPPLEFPGDVAALSPNGCLYASFCRSFTDEQYGWYHEPQFEKAIY